MPGPFITLNVINCGIPVAIQLLSLTGQIQNNHASLQWITTGEDEPVLFDIEKSSDGINFRGLATVNGYNDPTAERNTYRFVDPEPLTGKIYYRVLTRNNAGQINIFTNNPTLRDKMNGILFVSVINPFSQ